MDKLQLLIEQLQSLGETATIVFYVGHYNDDGEDVIDAAIYDGHPNIACGTLAESINCVDIEEVFADLDLTGQV